MRATRSIAFCVPASVRPATRIWQHLPAGVDQVGLAGDRRRARAPARRSCSGSISGPRAARRRSAARRRATAGILRSARPMGVDRRAGAGRARPARACVSSTCRPFVASVVSGMPRLSPPVRLRPSAGTASASISPPAAQKNRTGRRMIDGREPVPEAGRRPRARRSSTRRGMIRQRLTLRPMTASSAGSSVAEAAIETSGTSSPPTPIERMNGSGMKTSSASPIATVMPGEQRRPPGRRHRRAQRSWTSSGVRASSSRKRNTTSIE